MEARLPILNQPTSELALTHEFFLPGWYVECVSFVRTSPEP
ncbi:adipose differentiation related protein, isoform CRA_e [Rattus norvegicus]|nr:adipose differentiation related protein, isoform CRA_e [Rattus norvegicus]